MIKMIKKVLERTIPFTLIVFVIASIICFGALLGSDNPENLFADNEVRLYLVYFWGLVLFLLFVQLIA